MVRASTVSLDDDKEKVRNAFNAYMAHCPHSDAVVPIRANQFLDDLLGYVDNSRELTQEDYLNIGRHIKEIDEQLLKSVTKGPVFDAEANRYVTTRVLLVGFLSIAICTWWSALLVDTNKLVKMDHERAIRLEERMNNHEKADTEIFERHGLIPK